VNVYGEVTESHCGKFAVFITNTTATYKHGHGQHTLTAVPVG